MKILALIFLFSLSTAHSQSLFDSAVDELRKVKGRVLNERPEQSVAPEAEASREESFADKALQKSKEVAQKTTEDIKKINHQMDSAQLKRERSSGTVSAGFQPLASWLPGKKVLSYTYIFSKDWSAEFEYSWASVSFPVFGIDLGEISEKRYTLQARRYIGNSFNFTFGLFKNDFDAHLGSDMLERMGHKKISLVEVGGTGFTAGLGNRWQFKNGFTFGADWVRVNVPLFDKKVDSRALSYVSNPEDQTEIKKAIRYFRNYPTFVILGLSVGYTF